MAKYKPIQGNIEAVQVVLTKYGAPSDIPSQLIDSMDNAFSEQPKWLLVALAKRQIQPRMAEDGLTVDWQVTGDRGAMAHAGDWIGFTGDKRIVYLGNNDLFQANWTLVP